MMQAFKSMAILGLFLLSCQDASFVTGVKKKSQDSIPAQDKPQDLPAQPESPHDDSSEETNCTDLKAEDCKKKKEEEGSSTSFRDVDCQGKDQEACEKLI